FLAGWPSRTEACHHPLIQIARALPWRCDRYHKNPLFSPKANVCSGKLVRETRPVFLNVSNDLGKEAERVGSPATRPRLGRRYIRAQTAASGGGQIERRLASNPW